MLTEKEKQFLLHWEKVREEYGQFTSKLVRGLPMALLFTLPIILMIALVYFLSPEWYTKISKFTGSSTIAIFLSLFIITLFFSVARMHYKWEMNEQLFQELSVKKNKQQQEGA